MTSTIPKLGPGVATIPVTQTSTGNFTIQNTTGTHWTTATVSPTIKIQGDAEVDGDIKIRGKSLVDTLDRIEKKLAILVPNIKLEAEWEQLAALRQQYVELERELQEKQRVFDILKKQ